MNGSEKLAKLQALSGSQAEPPPQKTKNGAKTAGILGVILAFLAKFKVALLVVLSKLNFLWVLLKAAKFTKFLLTFGSMATMILVYSGRFGLSYSVGFVLLILIHELGHGLAAKQQGLPAGAPIFIPFFGAFIALKQHPRTAEQEFIVAAAGPLAGGLGAFAAVGLASIFPEHSGLLYAVAGSAFVMNLFNLIPWYPLDGGRMTMAFPALVLLALGAVALSYSLSATPRERSPVGIFLVIGILLLCKGAAAAFGRFKRNKSKLDQLSELNLSARKSFQSSGFALGATATYAFLAAGLVYGAATWLR